MWDISRDVDVTIRDISSSVVFNTTDPESGKPVDFSTWSLILYGRGTIPISTDSTLLTRVSAGQYKFLYDSTKYYNQYELLLSIAGNLSDGSQYLSSRIIKPLSPAMIRDIIYLRNQIDKSMKSIGKTLDNLQYRDNKEALDSYFKDFPVGYTDAHCALYLELAINMINIVSPYTYFTIDNFPYSRAFQILIDAATIVALESQGIFSIDTDFDYNLGGKSLTVRHFENTSGFIREINDRFSQQLRTFKSAYRMRGVAYLQQPYGIVGFRLIQLAPTWLARFGIGVSKWQ